jgi:hypothetical protein
LFLQSNSSWINVNTSGQAISFAFPLLENTKYNFTAYGESITALEIVGINFFFDELPDPQIALSCNISLMKCIASVNDTFSWSGKTLGTICSIQS